MWPEVVFRLAEGIIVAWGMGGDKRFLRKRIGALWAEGLLARSFVCLFAPGLFFAELHEQKFFKINTIEILKKNAKKF